jgi:regulator of RNase E activity RraA
VITNGTVRDIDEVEKLDFGMFAAGLQVSHGYAHLEGFGEGVTVFGMRVASGDLVHADKHGAVTIPREIAHWVAEAARKVERDEKPMLAACRLADPIEELDKLVSAGY